MTAAFAVEPMSEIGVARTVLAAEIDGLRALSAGLDASFGAAVEKLASAHAEATAQGSHAIARRVDERRRALHLTD